MLKRIWRRYAPNPFDHLLKKALTHNHKKILFAWNRGLGDIPLGLYALIYQIRKYIPDAEISCITRKDLYEGFKLLENVEVLVDEEWKRGSPICLNDSLQKLEKRSSDFDLIIEKPDPTWWVKWQIGTLTPRLRWNPAWDLLWEKFPLTSDSYIGIHIQTETKYGYEKNWPADLWDQLIERLLSYSQKKVILFGLGSSTPYPDPRVVDLRGKTSLFETLSIIKNKCSHLVVPDSGILSLTYYLDISFPIRIVSLWADPRQGVLKQNVASPNPKLIHIPLKGDKEMVRNIPLKSVEEALCLHPM